MHLTSRTRLARPFLATVLTLVFAPGCELATHFGDFQQSTTDSGGLDGAGADAGDTGPHDAGHDSAMDANVDAAIDVTDANLPDSGVDGGGDGGLLQRHVHVTIAGAGGGMVDAMGGALVCSSGTCDWMVDDGAVLSLHGAPNATSTLASWGGACATTTVPGDCPLTVTSDVSLTATFAVLQVHVTVVVANPPGTVTATTPSINCDGTLAASCTGTVPAGTSVVLTAAPTLPNTDVAWAGATCTGTTCTFTANADITITATFSDGRPVLDVTETGHGTVATSDSRINCINGGTDCSEIYPPATSVTLTATPEVGYTFTSWTGCDSNPMPNQCTVSLADGAHVTVGATFTINHYMLTVNVTGTALGTVTSSSPMLTCTSADGTCTVASVAYGTSVSLTAAPGTNARFQNWSGVTGCDTGSTCTFTVTADVNATATFVTDTRTVTVVIAGGDGQVTSSAAPFNCTYAGGSPTAGSTCTATLPLGSAFDLGITAHAGYHVTGWVSSPIGIGCGGSATTCTGTVVPAITAAGGTVTVNLAATLYTLDVVATAATGSGTVETHMGGSTVATCVATAAGDDCPAMYAYGTMVTLHAVPAGTSLFLGWSGACSGTADCTLTIDAAKSVSASFSVMTTVLQVNTSGPATGTVTSITPPGAIGCGATCSATLGIGTAVTLHAMPAPNYVFNGWGGSLCSGFSDCNLVIASGANLVSAQFLPVQEMLTVNVTGTGNGTVTDDPSYSRINCGSGGALCTTSYDYGTMVTLTAVPNATSVFTSWTGCTGTSGNICYVTMAGVKNVTANFSVATALVSVTPSGTGQGRVTSNIGGISCNQPTGGLDVCAATYNAGQVVTLTANPALHSHVSGWAGCSSVSADMLTCTVNVGTSSMTIRPVFDVDTFLLTVTTTAGLGSVSSSETPADISCPGTCSHAYPWGTTVTLTATPSSGDIFTGWSGVAGCGSGPVCSLTVSSAMNATANFVQGHYINVTLPANNPAAGSRVFMPGGVTCTTQATSTIVCSALVAPGTYTMTTDGRPAWLGPIWGSFGTCQGPTCTLTVGTSDLNGMVTWGQLGNIMFVTSTTSNGLFGGSGLTSANMLCQQRAMMGNLPAPGSFIAWLSTSTSPMMNRLSFSDNVWIRPDGRPIATNRGMMLSGAIMHPIVLDEMGNQVLGLSPGTNSVWTGTTQGGGPSSAQMCSDWTSTAPVGQVGLSTNANAEWTQRTTVGCGGQAHLYCLQVGASVTASVLPTPPTTPVYIFQSGASGTGGVTVSSMDASCASEASSAGLPGTYVALVSTSVQTAYARATRFGTLVRPDGWPIGPHQIGDSVLATPSQQPLATFSIQANRSLVSSGAYVWTGMNNGANSTSSSTCSNWGSPSGTLFGADGDPGSIFAWAWSDTNTDPCTNTQHWYCVQSGP